MRYVSQPELLHKIDPRRAAGNHRDAATSPPAPIEQAQKPSPAKGVPSSWPVTLQEADAIKKARQTGAHDTWSEAEIRQARQRCAAIFKRIAAVAINEEPIRQGECGDPAPIRLISIGRNPEVVISPPALVNCEMAEAMHTWLKSGLQPLARQHLGGPIIKIAKMSDYSCRNAYGRAKGRLSEHGRANALDIAGFTTARGDMTMLLADWGQTKRDIRRQLAAAKAKAVAAEQKRLAAEQRGQERARTSLRQQTLTDDVPESRNAAIETGAVPPGALGATSGAPAGGIARASVVDGIPLVTVSIPGATQEEATSSFASPPSRLGGPKPHELGPANLVVKARSGSAVGEIRKQHFLRGAHKSACGIFGTVLGPEANNAHRNHFHVDLAERKTGAFCQ